MPQAYQANQNKLQSKTNQYKRIGLFVLILSIVYLLLHLFNLNNLPVFADESIYIRWAQLIIDDWQQYLFFPLNDGKTPLFIWLLVPFQLIIKDQLIAGRLLAVMVGLVQVWANYQLTKIFVNNQSDQKSAKFIAAGLSLILPFWYFHHRIALMDGALTLFLTIGFTQFVIALRKASGNQHTFRIKQINKNSVWAGLFLGMALWTKIPALLFLPVIAVTALIFWGFNRSWRQLLNNAFQAGITVLIALGLFLLLKLHPAFGQLFNRGGDFLFSAEEIIGQQAWKTAIANIPVYLRYLGHYLTWPVFLLAIAFLFSRCGNCQNQSKSKSVSAGLLLNLVWIVFCAPIFLLGKVIYPRYLLPAAPFITVAASLQLSFFWSQLKEHQFRLRAQTAIYWAILISTVILTGSSSLKFISHQLLAIEKTRFELVDQMQYLTSWSAGFGVKQTKELIVDLAQDQKLLILTEGYFGTLPDGLLMYFHGENVDNIFIAGIGQPVRQIPDQYLSVSSDYDRTLLVANSHRIKMDLSKAELLLEICRPAPAPCHQVWDVTPLLEFN